MKRLLVLLLCISLCVVPVSAARVATEDGSVDVSAPIADFAVPTIAGAAEMNIEAKSAVLLEPVTGQILFESNADEKLPPASITKIMSLILVMEAIDSGVLTLETEITASEHACSMGGSQIWLEPNEKMTVHELLKATVIASANDATVALGEAIAGSEEAFVAKMNERARQLGMNSTNFINCTGLDAEGHLTTAHDVALMSAELIKHGLIKNYSTVWMDSLRGGESELVNTNKLVRFYEGCTGLKTGTTSGAGHCLAATAERDGLSLVAVVMGADNSNKRFEGAKKMLNYGFANFKFQKITADLSENNFVEVEKGLQPSVQVSPANELNILLPKASTDDITQTLEINDSITAPVNKGDSVGRVVVKKGEEEIGVIELCAAENVEKLNMGHTLLMLFKALVCI